MLLFKHLLRFIVRLFAIIQLSPRFRYFEYGALLRVRHAAAGADGGRVSTRHAIDAWCHGRGCVRSRRGSAGSNPRCRRSGYACRAVRSVGVSCAWGLFSLGGRVETLITTPTLVMNSLVRFDCGALLLNEGVSSRP